MTTKSPPLSYMWISWQKSYRTIKRGIIQLKCYKKKKNLPAKNTVSSYLSERKKKYFSKQVKAEGVHHHITWFTRNPERRCSSRSKKTLISNTKTSQKKQHTGKGKYTVRFRIL